jgi:hypothetical protein
MKTHRAVLTTKEISETLHHEPDDLRTLDDVAFALSALEREKDGLGSLIYALKDVLKMARRQGACGADTAISAAVSDLEARK